MGDRRGLIMQPESVLAIIAGTKTQTRRVVSDEVARAASNSLRFAIGSQRREILDQFAWRCPYGKVGDTLWVRERHAWADQVADGFERDPPCTVWYKADLTALRFGGDEPPYQLDTHGWRHDDESRLVTWRPARWMPRWCARIRLKVTAVRLERVQEITEADAQAEGLERPVCTHPDCTPGGCASSRFRPEFAIRWDAINGKRRRPAGARAGENRALAWRDNPWVWAITFKEHERWGT